MLNDAKMCQVSKKREYVNRPVKLWHDIIGQGRQWRCGGGQRDLVCGSKSRNLGNPNRTAHGKNRLVGGLANLD